MYNGLTVLLMDTVKKLVLDIPFAWI